MGSINLRKQRLRFDDLLCLKMLADFVGGIRHDWRSGSNDIQVLYPGIHVAVLGFLAMQLRELMPAARPE